jgi:hypothetical protein
MELLTVLLRLPFMPVTGVIRLAEIIADEADRQLHDPARIRRELEEAQRLHDEGQITDEELRSFEEEATRLLVPGLRPPETRATPPASEQDGR